LEGDRQLSAPAALNLFFGQIAGEENQTVLFSVNMADLGGINERESAWIHHAIALRSNDSDGT
jgi:hypothetical protein